MYSKQRGFTLVEKVIAFIIIAALIGAFVSAYVAYHFIQKFW